MIAQGGGASSSAACPHGAPRRCTSLVGRNETVHRGRISEIHHIAIRFMRASKSLNSDALQRRLHYHSAWLRTTQARSTSSRRGDFSWGAAPNPECKQVSCGFPSVRGVGRSPTLKIRALRNMLIGSTARSMRRSGNGMRLRRRRQVGRGRSPSPEGAARARAIFASLRS